VEKHWPEMILYCAGLFFNGLAPIFFFLFDFKQSLTCGIMLVNVPDLKVHKFDLGLIGLKRAEIA
jgi:hypothetical protein